jgi:hypothetical protein
MGVRSGNIPYHLILLVNSDITNGDLVQGKMQRPPGFER